jgi:hypothetical protein
VVPSISRFEFDDVKPLQLRRIVPILGSYDAIRWTRSCQFNREGFDLAAKLHINISQGIIDIEGEADLVREIYADFKEQLSNGIKPATSAVPSQLKSDDLADESFGKQKSRRRTTPKKKLVGEEGGNSVVANNPKLDKDLDTSKLMNFYNQYEPKNNAEKILIFLKFLNDELKIEVPNTDQVYTCFEKSNERVPKVFAQAFIDAAGKKFGYIDYNSPSNLKITTIGSNHFRLDLKKKTAE